MKLRAAKQFMIVLLVCFSSALAENAFQAQHGWGLAQHIATPNIAQGIVIDPEQKRIIIAEVNGLEQRDLNGQQSKILFATQGVRYLRGTGTGQQLTMAWYRRDPINPSGVMWWYKGKAVLALETPISEFVVLLVKGVPTLLTINQVGTKTEVYMQSWGQKATRIYQTTLNIGALAASVTSTGKIGVLFAEGYRNAQDEKYDARFLKISNNKTVTSKLIAPAVFIGKDQRYGVAVYQEQLLPIWWFETVEEQRLAAFTHQHYPRLAILNNNQILEFAAPANIIGQIGNAIYYANKNFIYAFDLEKLSSQVQITTPESFSTAALASGSDKFMAWQSLQRDGFSNQLWIADSSQAFTPSFVDQASVALGWNPWFPLQNLLGQSALTLVLSILAMIIVVPVVWLLHGRLNLQQGVLFGTGFAWFILLALRIWGGTLNTPNWVFTPLLTPSWLVVIGGLIFASCIVFWQRKKLLGIELGATLAAGIVVLVASFITIFSRIGYLQF